LFVIAPAPTRGLCCFGPGDVLYITSARHGLSDEELDRQPQAGAVFAAEVAATAAPATLWSAGGAN